MLPRLRSHLQSYCRPDRFSLGQPRNRYSVGSLYLDNKNFDLYRATVERRSERFKLRIRSYSDDPDTPVFFEIKRRADSVVRKSRAMVSRPVAEQFLAGQPVSSSDPDLDAFIESCAHARANPTLRVRYEREAYESRADDQVRITIDHDIMHAITPGPDISLDGPGWSRTPSEGAVLEIKLPGNAPTWVTEMVRALGVERTSVAKYVLSLDRVFLANGRAPWSRPMGEGA